MTVGTVFFENQIRLADKLGVERRKLTTTPSQLDMAEDGDGRIQSEVKKVRSKSHSEQNKRQTFETVLRTKDFKTGIKRETGVQSLRTQMIALEIRQLYQITVLSLPMRSSR